MSVPIELSVPLGSYYRISTPLPVIVNDIIRDLQMLGVPVDEEKSRNVPMEGHAIYGREHVPSVTSGALLWVFFPVSKVVTFIWKP